MKAILNKEVQRSKKSAWIGIIVLIVGAIMIFVGAKNLIAHNAWVKEEEAKFTQEYDEWQNNWWNHNSDLDDMPRRPSTMPPVGQILLVFGGAAVVFIGLCMVISGKASESFLSHAEGNKEFLNDLAKETSEDVELEKGKDRPAHSPCHR